MRATRLGFWLASPALAFILMFLYFPAFLRVLLQPV